MERFGIEEIEAVTKVIKSRELSGFYRDFKGGKIVQAFEEAFAEYHNVDYAISTSSGTTALHTALLALGVGKRLADKVITTPYTFVASASSILMANAIPVFRDVSPQSYTLYPYGLGTSFIRPVAIMPVHLLGHPSDMDPILDIARKNKCYVIEDACQALGARYKGKLVGTIGDVGCFGQATKVWTPEGKRRIAEIQVGDTVLTPNGSRKVIETHKRYYAGLWVRIQFGKMDTSLKVSATADHPILAHRNGKNVWLPARDLVEGDMVYIPTSRCEMCGSLIPFYRKLCETCYKAQTPRARRFQREQRLETGERLKKKSTDKHWKADIKPVAQELRAEGYRVIPTVRPLPDLIAIKNGKVFAIEVENKVTPRLSKIEQYVGVDWYDDIIWITKEPKKRSDVYGHAIYEIEGNLARVPVLKITHYKHNLKGKRFPVYNLSVEGEPVYFAQGILVHNCFSFQETKGITTGGEGGMIITNNKELAERCQRIRNHGEKYAEGPELGYNFRLTEMQAAFGLAQLQKLDKFNKIQIRNAEYICKHLPEGIYPPHVSKKVKHVYFLIGCIYHEKSHLGERNLPISREEFLARLEERGLVKKQPGENVSKGYDKLIYEYSVLQPYKTYCPVAEGLLKESLWIDLHRWKTRDQVKNYMKIFKEVLE